MANTGSKARRSLLGLARSRLANGADPASWLKNGDFWNGTKKLPHVGHTGIGEGLPFLLRITCRALHKDGQVMRASGQGSSI